MLRPSREAPKLGIRRASPWATGARAWGRSAQCTRKWNARGATFLREGREKIAATSSARPRLRPGRHPSTVTPSIDRYDRRVRGRAERAAKCGQSGSRRLTSLAASPGSSCRQAYSSSITARRPEPLTALRSPAPRRTAASCSPDTTPEATCSDGRPAAAGLPPLFARRGEAACQSASRSYVSVGRGRLSYARLPSRSPLPHDAGASLMTRAELRRRLLPAR
jgi:hypothetical protein